MRMTDVNIPIRYPTDDGLDAIKMDRLGQLVLIAGPNGSGKSRLLAKLVGAFVNQPRADEIARRKKQLSDSEAKLRQERERLGWWTNLAFQPEIVGESRDRKVAESKTRIASLERTIESAKNALLPVVFQFDTDRVEQQIVHFVPKKLELQDPKKMGQEALESHSKQAHSLGVEGLHTTVLPKIQDLHNQYWHATHQDSVLTRAVKDRIREEYLKLQQSIETLLGVRLGNDERGSATLFDRPVGNAGLSDGQKVLLQLAVALHCQGAEIGKSILLLDEPENHIHPKAIIEVIETLIKSMPAGQIWIATHSVSVLAHFADQGSLWYMDKGKVSPAGKIQEKVLHGLLGDEQRIARQREFLEKPDIVALNRYAKQCLCPPGVLMTGPDDPQVAQIRKVIDALYAKHTPLKLLDLGAGKGRLLANLIEEANSTTDISQKLDYIAYDTSTSDKESCEAYIAKAYQTANNRWFGTYADLLTAHNKGSFHVVVLCNVLHEIEPEVWKRLFGPTGEITELLSEDGQLLIVEDQHIRVGENAHKYGFIVLDTGALKDLFLVRGNDEQILSDSQRGGRLKAHLIPRKYLERVTPESIAKALETHRKHAESEITRIRCNGKPEDGRLHAFWLVQYANVTLAQREATA